MNRRCLFLDFRFVTTVVLLAVASTGALPVAEASQYLGPTHVVASPDQTVLYVVQYDGQRVDVVDVQAGEVKRSIACPARPTGVAVSADGARLFITCEGPAGVVCIADPATGEMTGQIAVGHTPGAPVLSPDGSRLYVSNRFNNNVSVIDLETGKELQRVPAIREPIAAAISKDGASLFVCNLLPNDPADSYDVAAEITVIDTQSLTTSNIRLLNGSSSVFGICVSPDGKYAYVTHILSRYQMPTTQLERGWMNTNALSILDVAEKKLVNTVLLDDIDLGAANPHSVATTADGKTILVTHSGTHEVSAIDAEGLHEKLASIPKTMEEAKETGRFDGRGTYSSVTVDDVPNDLAFLVDLRRRITLRRGGHWGMLGDEGPLVNGPRGLDVIGTTFYAALYFSDALAVVDLEDKAYYPVKLIPLGPEPELTVVRRGEMFFHDADLCFQKWQSCASCHPGDARIDALNWDLLNDGIGNPKNNKSLLLAHQTPPSMSLGVRANAEDAVRAGIRHIQFMVRPEEDAVAIDEYLKTLTPVPSPYLVDGQLSAAALRGKEIFFNQEVGCARCHPEPLYTDLQMHNVGSRGKYGRETSFVTPTLIEVWRTAPYMHDGRWVSMKELFTEGRHGAIGGSLEGLSEQDIDDLVEFVLSL
jgi:YVTN family beta-propeller protein